LGHVSERLPFAVAETDLRVASADEVDRADGRVVVPAVRPTVRPLDECVRRAASVGLVRTVAEVAVRVGNAEVAVAGVVVIKVPFLPGVDELVAAGAGGVAGVDVGSDGGSLALVVAPAAAGGCAGWLASARPH
jgi:hypothetical protein